MVNTWTICFLTFKVIGTRHALCIEDMTFSGKLICLLGFLTSSSATRRTSVNHKCCHTQHRAGLASVSVGHIILTPTQPIGSGQPQRGSNPIPPQQESRALPTKLPPPSSLEKHRRTLFHLAVRHAGVLQQFTILNSSEGEHRVI